MLWVKAMPEGKYAVDNDKRWDIDENILSDLVSRLFSPFLWFSGTVVLMQIHDGYPQGRVMEKMVTSDEKELKRFMLSSPESGVSEEERNAREAYRYCKVSTGSIPSWLSPAWLIPHHLSLGVQHPDAFAIGLLRRAFARFGDV